MLKCIQVTFRRPGGGTELSQRQVIKCHSYFPTTDSVHQLNFGIYDVYLVEETAHPSSHHNKVMKSDS